MKYYCQEIHPLKFICESKEIIEEDEYIVIDMVLIPPEKSVDFRYISEITKNQLDILDTIYNDSYMEELVEISNSFEETFEEFKVSLRIDIANNTKRLNFIDGIIDIFLIES